MRAGAIGAVALGGALGGYARLGIDLVMPAESGQVPWATFTVNVSGAAVLALLLTLLLESWVPYRYLRPFLAVGFLGSFTTFSTWMLEVHALTADGHPAVAAGLAATSLGLVLGRGIVVRRHRAREVSR
ncbi:MAG: CrcB family protein [Propionibacteriales bacterium]|nr:CrcB family protein [Propionibacteriales bacterium]